MPPKAQQPSKKAEQKKKEKVGKMSFFLLKIRLFQVLEDKTFGMKNKKGHQNQKYVEQMKKQVKLCEFGFLEIIEFAKFSTKNYVNLLCS